MIIVLWQTLTLAPTSRQLSDVRIEREVCYRFCKESLESITCPCVDARKPSGSVDHTYMYIQVYVFSIEVNLIFFATDLSYISFFICTWSDVIESCEVLVICYFTGWLFCISVSSQDCSFLNFAETTTRQLRPPSSQLILAQSHKGTYRN